MWQAEGTGVWVAGLETVMSVHLKTMHRPKHQHWRIGRMLHTTCACAGAHGSRWELTCGQAGRARSVETTPVGSKSLTLIEKHGQESTAVGLARDIENMLVRPTCQNRRPALEAMHGFRPLSKHH